MKHVNCKERVGEIPSSTLDIFKDLVQILATCDNVTPVRVLLIAAQLLIANRQFTNAEYLRTFIRGRRVHTEVICKPELLCDRWNECQWGRHYGRAGKRKEPC